MHELYRNIDANWEWDRRESVHASTIPHPCLMVTAENDAVLTPESSRSMESRIPRLSRAHFMCAHWTQFECTEELNAILVKWLVIPPSCSCPSSSFPFPPRLFHISAMMRMGSLTLVHLLLTNTATHCHHQSPLVPSTNNRLSLITNPTLLRYV